jgi:signal transduction histidine kinase/CheY-like chemotaxis protein
MNYQFVLAVCGAALGGFFAVLSLAFAKAPGWRGLRWFALIAASAAGYCVCNAAIASTHDDEVVTTLARICFALAGINTMAWMRYSTGTAAPRPVERVLEGLALVVAAVALVPGVLLGSNVVRHDGTWTHADYVVVPSTTLGVIAFALLFTIVAVPFSRYVARWRAGELGAGAHAVALSGLAVTGGLDAVDCTWIHGWPHLAPLGLVWTVTVVGCTLASRFVAGACELDALSARLDATVEQRTGELAHAQETLIQVDKLAALGRLSAAVAHEINNPAAAIAANLGYLTEGLKVEGAVPEDALDVMKDTLESIDRIARIVRQLGDAGELAIRGGATTAVALAETARRAVADASAELRDGVAVSLDVPEDLHVRTQEGSLRQVLTGLIVTAAIDMHAGQRVGCIRIHAVRQGDRVFLRVADPSPHVDDAADARRLDLFLSARPTHVARGVGLSVSVALLKVFGGNMVLERGGEEGSTVRIDIQAAEAPRKAADAPISSRAPRARVLLVDDDVLVRIGLRRLLGREYVLDEAGTADEALAIVAAHGEDLDAIVCDLVMPDGGAGKVLQGLERIAPRLALATVLMTGGAVDEETQAVLDANAERVLRKPVDVASLRALIERVRRRRSQLGLAAPERR